MDEELNTTASYVIPTEIKERIDQMAKEQDKNSSQIMRQILREHFGRLDAYKKAAQTAKVAA